MILYVLLLVVINLLVLLIILNVLILELQLLVNTELKLVKSQLIQQERALMDMLEQQMEITLFVNYVEQLMLQMLIHLLPILKNVNQQLKLKNVILDLY